LDLLDLIRSSIAKLPDGPYLNGLRSVLHHIDTAYKHFARGQLSNDESAFTDAIYRTNQAFEGSIKEAYRVLTKKDPSKFRPFEIEKYLEDKKVFKDRILSQFTNYRTQWRNPSTHDYNLIFDEDEAFLAIISVSAFTKLLIDQIAEQLAFSATKIELENISPTKKADDLQADRALIDEVVNLFSEFVQFYAGHKSAVPIESEAQLMGALAGFLSTVAPKLASSTGRIIRKEKPYYVDMIIERDGEQVIVELKRGKHDGLIQQGLDQLLTYVTAAEASNGLLFLYSSDAADYVTESYDDPSQAAKIRIFRPKR
jgi:hypothetical protein